MAVAAGPYYDMAGHLNGVAAIGEVLLVHWNGSQRHRALGRELRMCGGLYGLGQWNGSSWK